MDFSSVSTSSTSGHHHHDHDHELEDDFEIVERDPTGRYVRYADILGVGATKTVYKAFDEVNGIEVAWNRIKLSEDILNSGKHLENICSEAHLLKSLKHENVIRCFHSWIDSEHRTINMITELFTSGNLRLYRDKHGHLENKAIKKWAAQILQGLDYLHSHNPPIVHRDLKCENIFVNGNSGSVKIGDLGLATVLQHHDTAHSVIGTPEFMAPELYEEDYDQKVDIYSFGMCMLQMVTRELPYCECKNPAQIFKKVTSGVKPESLSKVTDPQVKDFIEKCLAPVEQRPSASDLLHDPFLRPVGVLLKVAVTEKNTFRITGEIKDGRDFVSMTLWVADLDGEPKRVDFVFFPETDTVVSVTDEMVKELELSSRDAVVIAELMAELMTELVPDSAAATVCQKFAKPEDDLRLDMHAEESADKHQHSQDEVQYDPERKSECICLNNKDSDGRQFDQSMKFDKYQKQKHDMIKRHDCKLKQEEVLGYKRAGIKERNREMAGKLLSSCLKKLVFRCRS